MVCIIDLSVPTEASPSEACPVIVDTVDHHRAPALLGLQPDDFPDCMAISLETVTLTTHTGTHMDAPLHYGPLSGGLPARSIDQVPLEWCFAPGVRLDVRHRGPGETITASDFDRALRVAGDPLEPGNIALVWTGADRLWGQPGYLTDYPGLSAEATAYLVERGVRVIGIDAWGLDRPSATMIAEYRGSGDSSELWPAHLYGRQREYCQLEKLANLGKLPGATGFTVACFPTPVSGAGAGWTRVVGIIEER